MVSTPVTLIDDPPIPRPDLHFPGHGSFSSSYWSGAVIEDLTLEPYVWSIGTFNVPNFFPYTPGTTLASMWTGLGGYYSNDPGIIQDGITYQSTGSIGTRFAWIEYHYPNWTGDITQQIAGPDIVHPEDSVTFWAFVGGPNGAPGTGYGWYTWQNLTTGYAPKSAFRLQAPTPPNLPPNYQSFIGESADFVIERPQYNSGYFPVSDFTSGDASMLCGVVDSHNTWHNFADAHYMNITMTRLNNSQVQLVTGVVASDNTHVNYTFVQQQ
jgi:hypothetical protein